MNDWQEWAAAGVVIATIAGFVLRARRRARAGKGGGCDDCGPRGCG